MPSDFAQSRAYLTLPIVGRVELGPMRDGERNFVLSSWTQGLTDAAGHGPKTGSKHRTLYLEKYSRLVDDVMSTRETQVRVARDAEDQALAYGWCCWAGDTVQWMSVKRAFRRVGIASALLPDGMRHYAWSTRFDDVAKRRGLSLRPMETKRRAG